MIRFSQYWKMNEDEFVLANDIRGAFKCFEIKGEYMGLFYKTLGINYGIIRDKETTRAYTFGVRIRCNLLK